MRRPVRHAFLSILAVVSASLASPRERLSLDFGWRFRGFPATRPVQAHPPAPDDSLYPPSNWSHNGPANPAFDDSNDTAWRDVDVPHDFVVEGTFSGQDK